MTNPFVEPGEVRGYLVNTMLSEGSREAISKLREELERSFPEALWMPPSESLHVTVMDWLSPLVDYGRDKDVIFREVGAEYIGALEEALAEQGPISITFDSLEAYPEAIIVRGHDDGSIRKLREQFLGRCSLLPGTKVQGAGFIHSTISRYAKPLDLDKVRSVVARCQPNFVEKVGSIQLSLETRFGMKEYKTLREFQLQSETNPQ